MMKIFRFLPDKLYITLQYLRYAKCFPNWKNPKTFNEKLQWLKLYDRQDAYTTMVDKYLVKDYVAKLVGREYIIPTLGVWDTASEIDFDKLPDKFVLKWNHDSGSVIICNDKSTFDRQDAVNKLNKWQDHNGFWYGREWPYKNVKPRINAEKYMEDDSDNHLLKDYKIFCFDGVPKTIMTVTGGHDDEEKILRRMYDTEWNLLPIGLHGHEAVEEAELKPEKLQEMLKLAQILSAGIPHIRTDFYLVNNQIYFGELTFYHMSGFGKMAPPEWEETFGSWIKLPMKRED